jgi:SAM-dependent methyltransferase
VERDTPYQSDLAWVHHTGYAHHVERVGAGLIRMLREHGLAAGARVLDVGCGSGLLAGKLLDAGFAVHGVDASEAMIALAREHVPGARFEVVRLPTGLEPGAHGGLPEVDAVVSTGHVLNYLHTREKIAQALGELARALSPGGVLAIDLMTGRYPEARGPEAIHAKVEDDWVLVTRFSQPEPSRFDRSITVFRRVDGHWRRSDELHRNRTFEADAALEVLREHGIDGQCRAAFGDETLPDGLVVLTGVRS